MKFNIFRKRTTDLVNNDIFEHQINSALRFRDISITIEGNIGSGKSYYASQILNLLQHLKVKRATVYEGTGDGKKVIISFNNPKKIKIVSNHISEKYKKMMIDDITKEYDELIHKLKNDKKCKRK